MRRGVSRHWYVYIWTPRRHSFWAAGSAALGARQFLVSSSSDHQPHINPSESAAGCTSSLLSFTTTTPAAFFHSRSLLVIMSFRKIAVAAALVAGLQMAGSSAQS